MSFEIAIIPRSDSAVASTEIASVPHLVAGAGDKAAQRFLEFFAVTIRNTRSAYIRACDSFFAWCDAVAVIDELVVSSRSM